MLGGLVSCLKRTAYCRPRRNRPSLHPSRARHRNRSDEDVPEQPDEGACCPVGLGFECECSVLGYCRGARIFADPALEADLHRCPGAFRVVVSWADDHTGPPGLAPVGACAGARHWKDTLLPPPAERWLRRRVSPCSAESELIERERHEGTLACPRYQPGVAGTPSSPGIARLPSATTASAP